MTDQSAKILSKGSLRVEVLEMFFELLLQLIKRKKPITRETLIFQLTNGLVTSLLLLLLVFHPDKLYIKEALKTLIICVSNDKDIGLQKYALKYFITSDKSLLVQLNII